MTSKLPSILLGLLVIILISGLSSFLTIRFLVPGTTDSMLDYHQWIHDQLGMTEEQERRLEASERRYEESRRHLEAIIRIANADLAAAIHRDKTYSPAVENAVAEIHEAMGDLQRATLEHIFEMKEVLEPDQYERLMDLTVEGLSENARQD